MRIFSNFSKISVDIIAIMLYYQVYKNSKKINYTVFLFKSLCKGLL